MSEDLIKKEILNGGVTNVKESDFGKNFETKKISEIRKSLEDYFGKETISDLLKNNKLWIGKSSVFDLDNKIKKVSMTIVDDCCIQGGGKNLLWIDPLKTSPEQAPLKLIKQMGYIATFLDGGTHADRLYRLYDICPVIFQRALKAKDPVAVHAKQIIRSCKAMPKDDWSTDEDKIFKALLAAGYKKKAQEKGLVRWFSRVKSSVNTLLYGLGLKDGSKLKPEDICTIVNGCVKEFAKGGAYIVHDSAFEDGIDLAYASTLYAIKECGLPKSLDGKFLTFVENGFLSASISTDSPICLNQKQVLALKENISRCVKEIKNKVIEIGKVSSVNTEVHKAIGGVER